MNVMRRFIIFETGFWFYWCFEILGGKSLYPDYILLLTANFSPIVGKSKPGLLNVIVDRTILVAFIPFPKQKLSCKLEILKKKSL